MPRAPLGISFCDLSIVPHQDITYLTGPLELCQHEPTRTKRLSKLQQTELISQDVTLGYLIQSVDSRAKNAATSATPEFVVLTAGLTVHFNSNVCAIPHLS